MKAIKILSTCVMAVLLSVYCVGQGESVDSRLTLNDGLVLQGVTKQPTYVLGEPVRIQISFANNGQTKRLVPSEGVEAGSLKIFVANKENGEYKEYRTAGWGTERGRPLDLEPGAKHHYPEATILWNGKPKLNHFSDVELNEALRGRIATKYAFQEPGVYFIKGRSFVGENFQPVESEPIRIEILKPGGPDLAVWIRIKGNMEIAYLMQRSSFNTEDPSKKHDLISEIEQILSDYPNSVYSSYLRPNLEKFKADEVRRKEMLKKANSPTGLAVGLPLAADKDACDKQASFLQTRVRGAFWNPPDISPFPQYSQLTSPSAEKHAAGARLWNIGF